MVIFSHWYLDSNSMKFQTFVYNTDIKIQPFLNRASTISLNAALRSNTAGRVYCPPCHYLMSLSETHLLAKQNEGCRRKYSHQLRVPTNNRVWSMFPNSKGQWHHPTDREHCPPYRCPKSSPNVQQSRILENFPICLQLGFHSSLGTGAILDLRDEALAWNWIL